MLKRLFLSVCGIAVATSALAEPFTFVALGDMPYDGGGQAAYPPLEALIDTINARAPAFTIHIGDIKSGKTECSDARLLGQRDYMNRFAGALVYTPGDNEWTDCHKKKAGEFDPLERLAFLRRTFFPVPKSLGGRPMALERQSEAMPEFGTYVENARFAKDGVLVVTAHVVGSNNNLEARDRKAAMEFFDRDEANIAWLGSSFDKAERIDATALVLAIHADMFEFDFDMRGREKHLRHSGFRNFSRVLVDRAEDFAKPVLLVYGDSHIFRIYRPYRKRAPNITALEVFGKKNMHAVEVGVDTDDAAVWSFRPILNPYDADD